MLTDFMPVVGAELFESKGMLMAVVSASGILIVFLILVLLIFIFYAYGGIFQAVTASGEKKKAAKAAKAAEEAAKAAEEQSVAAESAAAAAELADGEIPVEIIAVIAAAVASMSDGKNYVVKKVKRAPVSGRSAWAASGIFENTRPF